MMFRRTKSFQMKRSSAAEASSQPSASPTSSQMAKSSPLRRWRLHPKQNQQQQQQQQQQHRRSQSADTAMDKDHVQELMLAAAAQEVPRIRRTHLQIGKLLGEGGFAQVYQVQLKNNTSSSDKKNKLALKQLRQDLLHDKTLFHRAADALVREAAIMTELRGHPYILQLRGISGDASRPAAHKRGFDSFFLVTDALRDTMTDRIEQWRSSTNSRDLSSLWNQQLNYALQIAQALAYCHEQGIIYRDCKADNIGFQDQHTIQLFDFGLARKLPTSQYNDDDDSQTCASSVDDFYGGEEVFHMTCVGTQRYMAPEVYNRGWYNAKADCYSWSMTVLEILTHKKPHSYMSLPVHKILVLEGGGRPSLEGFPSGLQAILKSAWHHQVAQRWSMAQICAALEAYIGSDNSSSSTPTTLQQQSNDISVEGGKTSTPLLLQDQSRTHNLSAVQQQQQRKQDGTNKTIQKPVLGGHRMMALAA